MRKTWKRVLAIMCAAAMIFTSVNISPVMTANAATLSSGDEWIETANGLSVKITAMFHGESGGVVVGLNQDDCTDNASTADFKDVVDENESTGVIFRDSRTNWDGGFSVGDYLQVEFKEAITFEGVIYKFAQGNDKFNASTFSYTTDGSTWNELGNIESAATMSYTATEGIPNVKAIRLTNTVANRQWVKLLDISVDAAEAELVLNSISLTAPTKKYYYVGEELDTTGMVVTAAYSDGSTAELTADDYTVSELNSSELGTKTITVTCGEKTATFTVKVVEEGSAEDGSKDIDYKTFTVSAGSEEPTQGLPNEGPVRLAFDDKETTYWHSSWTTPFDVANYLTEMPKYFYVQMNFAEATVVDAVRYLPRGEGNGDITGYRIEGTVDGQEWKELTSGTWELNGNWKIAEFEAEELQGVRLVATETKSMQYETNNNKFANAKEIRVRTATLPEVPAVDKAALESAIEAADELVEDNYTVESWAAFAAALESAETVVVDEQATQDAVDKALADLTSAQAALEFKPANYDAVNAAIDAAEELEAENYVDFTAVNNAVNAVVRDKNITEQAAVDAMAQAIRDAIAALELKGADYAAVNEAIDAANALNAEDYVDFTAVTDAVNAVVRGKDITEQAAVDAMAQAIRDAIAELEEKTVVEPVVPMDPADDSRDIPVAEYVTTTAGTTQNGNGVDLALDGDTGTWWHTSWNPASTASDLWYTIELAEATEIEAVRYYPRYQGTNYNMGDANGYISKYRVEVSMDGETWEVAAEGVWANSSEELSGTWKIAEFDEAVTAKYVKLIGTETYSNGAPATQGMAIAEIRVREVGNEPEAPVVDKAALEAAIAATEDLVEDDYTEESWAAFAAALEAAQTVAADEEATQDAVDAAVADLAAAQDALELKPVDPVEPVDKAELVAAIEATEELVEDDYTADSWATFVAALAAAQDVADDADATQDEVDEALADLEAAQDALELKPVNPVEPADPTDDSKDVPTNKYTASAGSTQAGITPNAATDGNPSTFWEVQWDIGAEDPSALWYQIVLEEEVEIEAVRYLPRWENREGGQNGFIEEYYVEVSTDGQNWTKVAEGTWEMTEGWKIAQFDEAVTAKYVKLVATATYADVDANYGNVDEVSSNMSIAEIRVKSTSEYVDTAELEAAIAEAEELTADDYTAASWAALGEAIEAAQEVLDDEDATQEAVDAAVAALEAAITTLVDKSVLAEAIEEAEAIEAEGYTAESYAALEAAIAAAQEVLDDEDATQAELDAAVAALDTAVRALERVAPPVDKSELADAIEEAEAIEAEGYTAESYAALEAAIAAAQEVLDDEDATQEAVNAAVEALEAAVDALEEEVVFVNPFEDVFETDYYYDPVMWAVQNGITDGWTETLYAPGMGCTRGQVVTFLWRAAGEPKAQNAENPFKDVAENAYYYDAVLWAVEQGITDGWLPDEFAPDMVCTRGQIVTFIWRAAGEPAAEAAENPFVDVAENAYYYDAVLWAVENGITEGWMPDEFAPDMECTRGQIVTFLYRYYN